MDGFGSLLLKGGRCGWWQWRGGRRRSSALRRFCVYHFGVESADQAHHFDGVARIVALAQQLGGFIGLFLVVQLHDTASRQMKLAV